ncbi:MAG: DNA glycosylase, partial [Verrucomicrobiota bacterium]
MTHRINVTDFNLAATLECGQAFRWSRVADGWYTGVVGKEVWRLRQIGNEIEWQADPPHLNPLPQTTGKRKPVMQSPLPTGGEGQCEGLRHYLTLDRSLSAITGTFPSDDALQQAVQAHWGMRVLRQEPWETLASFIASSTKQIVQIRQIVDHLATRFGEPISGGYHAFPAIEVIARAAPQQLLDCKLGFRAKYLLAAAQMIDSGKVRLHDVPAMEYGRALEELLKIPGVGEKIANCTLLFSCGFNQAFPVDVWVERSVKRLYFPRRKVSAKKLREFSRSRFGPNAGWAQQYLFYAERIRD